MEQGDEQNTWEGFVDWRRRPAIKGRHGRMRAAFFVLVVEVLENLAFLANASNLVLYLTDYMHFSPSKSANDVTNFMGTAFLLALLGGFLSDAFFTTYHIYLISAVIELMGLVIMTTQARIPSLKPPPCADPTGRCEEVSGGQGAMLFVGLYTVALGVGGIKGSLPTHGAEQFDDGTAKGRKMRSSFFNYFVFSLACGALIAVTLVVWIEDNKGWEWGLGIATLAIFLSIPVFLAGSSIYRNKVPSGSPLTTIFKVLVAATVNKCLSRTPSNAIASMTIPIPTTNDNPNNNNTTKQNTTSSPNAQPNKSNKSKPSSRPSPSSPPPSSSTPASPSSPPSPSTKLPPWTPTSDPLKSPLLPVLAIIALAPLYDRLVAITHLRRIGAGLALSAVAMAVAALVEIKRKKIETNSGIVGSENQPLPISFLWIGFQYLVLGSADLFTLAGLLEFFFTEAPAGMRSLATALSWASLAMGYYLSSVIVGVVNRVTRDRPWLGGGDLSEYRLERFYWLMCGLSGVNFLVFVYWAMRYEYRRSGNNG